MRRAVIFVMACLFGGAASWLGACANGNDSAVDPGADGQADGGVEDAGSDQATVIADASPGAREGGHCSPVQGPECDLVLQDCSPGRQCVAVKPHPLVRSTACVAAGTGNRPVGAACCPGVPNQCVSGLHCTGPACTADSGATGRCSPYCCPGDDSVCGQSIPEGYSGTCDVRVVSPADEGNEPLYDGCSYRPPCRPFQQQPCQAQQTCLLQKDNATFRCSPIFHPPGKPAGANCVASNECQDGMACLTANDAGTCRVLCYRADAGGPFDASSLSEASGRGGCGAGLSCSGTVGTFPPYLGFCP
jgi:hypothetical protein